MCRVLRQASDTCWRQDFQGGYSLALIQINAGAASKSFKDTLVFDQGPVLFSAIQLS
jgi:hypothetical protein